MQVRAYARTRPGGNELPWRERQSARESSRLEWLALGLLALLLAGALTISACNDDDSNAANFISFGFALGALVTGGIFIAFLEPLMSTLRRRDIDLAEREVDARLGLSMTSAELGDGPANSNGQETQQ
jgi:hypothetical protein